MKTWSGRVREQAHKGSANEDHFAKNRWESFVQVTNQKYARNVKWTINIGHGTASHRIG